MSIRIAISTGDFNGIGPEIILKTLSESEPSGVTPVILGSRDIFEFYRNALDIQLDMHIAENENEIRDGTVNLLECFSEITYDITPGNYSVESGTCSMLAVEKGISLCLDHTADALVTAPISKEAVNKAGYLVPGHTEFLAEKTGSDDFMMMLVHEDLRVGLVTIHIPIRQIPDAIGKEAIRHYIHIMHQSLVNDFGISSPAIAVLGLNPHAGDGGIIGTEEIETISPALQDVQSEGIDARGPFPADSFFGTRRYKSFDGVLAMYHDQGLVPFKTLSFGSGVNFTAGLPIIRTSPDHGTAFDIAGEGSADPSSFRAAYDLAVNMTHLRKTTRRPHGA